MKLWLVVLIAVALGAAAAYWLSSTPRIVLIEGIVPRATAAPSPAVTGRLVFAGDIMLSRSVGDAMAARSDWRWPFRRVASATADADLAFANLETTISARGTKGGCGYCFRADPRALDGLTWAGFDVLSVANNHIWDYGQTAFLDTLSALAGGQISAVGGGRNLAEARMPVVYDAAGTSVAYLAYTDLLPGSACAGENSPGANCYDPVRMTEDIGRARQAADVVVVSFHTGEEYKPHNDHQATIYRAAVDAGADLVVGHHPHVTQDLERYKNGWIAYSLGNFVFDQNWSEETRMGMMLDVIVSGGSIVSVATRSVDISTEYQPGIRP